MAANLQQIVHEQINFLTDEELARVLNFLRSIRSEKSRDKHKSIGEKFAEIRARYSDVKWDDLPTDGAENLDHYLYGAPKK